MNKEAIGTLTGKFFHSVGLDRKTIEWQGEFLGLASPGLYRIQLFEWVAGTPSEQRLVPATDMRYWLIYDSVEAMNVHYKKCVKIQEVQERKEQGEAQTIFQGEQEKNTLYNRLFRIIERELDVDRKERLTTAFQRVREANRNWDFTVLRSAR